MTFETVDEVAVEPAIAQVYEHGWQSWSPTTVYPADGSSYRPVRRPAQVMSYRPGKPAPMQGFQGEGLLAVDPGAGAAVRLYATIDGQSSVPSIRASYVDGRVVVSADGPVQTLTGSTVDGVLAEATLRRPDDGWRPGGGRDGRHTEALSYLLAEMQVLHRAYPGARW